MVKIILHIQYANIKILDKNFKYSIVICFQVTIIFFEKYYEF